jgi:hypothetical protein
VLLSSRDGLQDTSCQLFGLDSTTSLENGLINIG